MSESDIIDILFGIGIIILITFYVLFLVKKKGQLEIRRENSVGEKYMQLIAVFIREHKGKLIDMSEDHAEMEVIDTDGSKEKLTITQDKESVKILWVFSSEATQLSKEFKFANNETQKVIMKAIAKEIEEAKKNRYDK